MTLQVLITAVCGLLNMSADNDKLTPWWITKFLNEDYISLAEELRFLPRRVMLATVPPAQAKATVTIINTPGVNDTVTIAGVTSTFVSTLTTPSVAGEVLIDSTVLNNNATNLYNAVNATPGNAYAHAHVKNAVVTLYARVPGTLGNGLTLATSDTAAFTLSGAFDGGVDALFPYPADFCALQSVKYYEHELDFRLPEQLDDEYPNWLEWGMCEHSHSTPRHYYREGNFIGFYPPVLHHEPIILHGYCVPSSLMNEGASYTAEGVTYASDVPAFPPQYHMILVYGAIQRILASKLFDLENAQTLLQYVTAQREELKDRFGASRVHPTTREY